jgi:putative CocE/NonD family hydrolase
MSLTSRFWAWFAKFPPAETRAIVVKKDIPVPMPDGVTLLANHYFPREDRHRPTILIRTPYGRPNWSYLGELFAERGFQVLLQSVRGTDGSGGDFDPFRQERADGLATIAWIKQQEWFTGDLATYGPSYLGHAQWAIAASVGPELKAMATQLTGPDLRRAIYPGESLALDTFLQWSVGWASDKLTLWHMLRVMRTIGRACDHLPLRDADVIAGGQPVDFWRAILEHNEPGDVWWQAQNFWASVSQVTAPVQLFGGWYDFFLPDIVGLYTTLQHAGHKPQLIIGPWAHSSWQVLQHDAREALTWFRAHILNDHSGLRSLPVHIYVMGAKEWRDYPEWPPTGSRPQRWHLQPGRGLALELPARSDPDHYRYDPANPTPAVGGIATRTNRANFGQKDQRRLEVRPDVLTYTSAPLTQDLEIIGPVQADLYVRSSLAHTDFFACLCDVAPAGKSINISSALVRVWPGHPARSPDGCLQVCIDLWPTAYRFRRGHRLRLQVSSGAHPHFARNPGSGEPLGTATTLQVAEQQIYHDPDHPSAVVLPIVD